MMTITVRISSEYNVYHKSVGSQLFAAGRTRRMQVGITLSIILLNRSLLFFEINRQIGTTNIFIVIVFDSIGVWHFAHIHYNCVSHIVMFMSSFSVASCRITWRFQNGNQKKDINSKLL